MEGRQARYQVTLVFGKVGKTVRGVSWNLGFIGDSWNLGFIGGSWNLGFREVESEVTWAVEPEAFWAEKLNDVYEVKKKNHEPNGELGDE